MKSPIRSMNPIRSMKWWGWGDEGVEFDISHRPNLWTYLSRVLGLSNPGVTTPCVALDDIALPPQRTNLPFAESVAAQLGGDALCDSKLDRLTHAFGKSLRDLFRLRRGMVPYAPDYVVFPSKHEDVEALVSLAAAHGVHLIPFGGGSNIAGCVEPSRPTVRTVVSVDMRRMNRLLTLDRESQTARIEAGALGPHLEDELNRAGFTLGHFPDSFRFSTLGGWVATRSAGMQSDRYGKIEDMVVALRMVTPAGTIETRPVPAASNGIDVNRLCIGSEGTLGILTEIVVQVHPIPARRDSYGYLFPKFASGVEAIRQCHRQQCLPVMSRLNDPGKTELSFAYGTTQTFLRRQAASLMKFYIARIRRVDLSRACLLLASFEGDRETFERTRSQADAIFRRHGAVPLGSGPGRAFQHGKYDFPYLRDFLLDRGVMADVSETATLWRNLLPLYESASRAIQAAIDAEAVPGIVGCHISHTYHTGASLYFTFGMRATPGQEMAQYLRVKKAAEDAFLAGGATLSHHHAVGYEHLPWLEADISPAGMTAIEALKRGLDPGGVMNPGKLSRDFSFEDWNRETPSAE